jgi:unsaturated rhamnogalacturonyl hydrolase
MIAPPEMKRLAASAADRLLEHNWRVWFWGDSIGVEGLLDATELTGDGRYLGYVHGLLKGWIARERRRSEFDYTAPGVALLRTYELTRDGALLEAARRHADYLASFRRTEAGAYLRYENAAIELPPQLPPEHAEYGDGMPVGPAENGGPCLFVDCVHFDAPFFAKLYEVTGEECYRELALANILPQIELLWDPAAGLFHHFWIERTRSRNGVLWGRGNGWGLLGVVLTLEHIGPWDAGAGQLRSVLSTAVSRLAELQDPSGAWRTVLTDPESYIESSTAAFFADVIARGMRLGLLPESDYCKVLDRAMRYVLTHVDSRGVLEDVSFETFPSTRLQHYRAMPRGAVVPWGQGPLLGCLRSYAALQDSRRLSEPPREAHAIRP